MSIAKGTAVRQIVKPIEGIVTDYSVDKESGELLIEVSYGEGEESGARFFKESELIVVANED